MAKIEVKHPRFEIPNEGFAKSREAARLSAVKVATSQERNGILGLRIHAPMLDCNMSSNAEQIRWTFRFNN